MRSVSPALEAHLQGETTTLATCLKVTLTNGTVYGFTDHDVLITYESVDYEPRTGYTPSSMASTDQLAVDNAEMEALLDSETITEADIIAGMWNHASLEMFMVNYADLTMGALHLKKGTIGEVTLKGSSFTAEMRGMAQPLQQVIGEVYSPTCRVERFGDARCGVNLAPYTTTTTVASVTDSSTITLTAAITTGVLAYGEMTFTGGLNAGLTREIKGNTGSAVTLRLPFPFQVALGDAVTVIQGCNRKRATCQSYSNIVNFRGEPYVPGVDKISKGPSR